MPAAFWTLYHILKDPTAKAAVCAELCVERGAQERERVMQAQILESALYSAFTCSNVLWR